MDVLLERFGYTPMGTFGRLYIPEFECYTVELPWAQNQPRRSCIPEGVYRMELGRYYRGGYPAYEVMEVPGRSLIKIHIGNTMEDILGCIAPGFDLGWVHGKWAVTNSRSAYEAFMATMENQPSVGLKVTGPEPATCPY